MEGLNAPTWTGLKFHLAGKGLNPNVKIQGFCLLQYSFVLRVGEESQRLSSLLAFRPRDLPCNTKTNLLMHHLCHLLAYAVVIEKLKIHGIDLLQAPS